MPTSYPGGLDNFTNPTATDEMDDVGVLHDEQHADANDAIEAIQAELGTIPSGSNYATVKARLDGFTAIHHSPAYISGRYYDSMLIGTTASTTQIVADRIVLLPFAVSLPVTFDEIGLAVTTAGTATLARVGIYEANATNGLPDALLLDQEVTGLDTTGGKTAAISVTLVPWKRYWLAMLLNGTSTVRGAAAAGLQHLGHANISDGMSANLAVLNKDVAYGPLPNPIGAVVVNNSGFGVVRLRAA